MARPEPVDTQPRIPSIVEYACTAVASWLIPGAGHWLLGYRVRGIVLGVLVLGTFWLGQVLAIPPEKGPYARKPLGVSRQVSPIFFACQAGNGFSTLLSEVLWGKPRYPNQKMDAPDRHLPRELNLAILLTSVSGILNYLIVLHILDPRTWAPTAKDREVQREETGGTPS